MAGSNLVVVEVMSLLLVMGGCLQGLFVDAGFLGAHTMDISAGNGGNPGHSHASSMRGLGVSLDVFHGC